MKTLQVTVDDVRPRSVAKNGNAAAARSSPGDGYLVLNKHGVLADPMLYLVFEQARKLAGTSGRVVSRRWYEKRMNCRIVESV